MKTRTEKEQMVADLATVFNAAQVGLLVDYRGLNVAQVTDLRRRLRDSQAQMKVLKNRMAKLAAKDTPFESLQEQFVDTRAFIFGEDPVGPAKVVTKYMGENEKLQFVTGVLVTGEQASALDEGRLKHLGTLPSRDELLAQLLSVMNAVPTKFVRTLNEVPAKFARTLAALAEARRNEG